MNWFISIVKIAGASFPVAASFVQLQAELDADGLDQRISRLEDPISQIHDDIPELCWQLFALIEKEGLSTVEIQPDFSRTFARPLAALEACGYVQGHHCLGPGGRFAGGLSVIDPTFLLYMFRLSGDSSKLDLLLEKVDLCIQGGCLDGTEIGQNLGIPVPVVRAVFEVFAARGYGFLSDELGVCQYISCV